MSLLSRFRKPGGLEKLVTLIESSDAKVRENILNNIRTEDPDFTEQVEAKLFFWNDLLLLDDKTLAEILSSVPPKTLALACYYTEEGPRNQLMAQLDRQTQAKIKDECDQIGAEPQKSLVNVSRTKVIESARGLERDGKITLRKEGVAVATIAPEHPEGKLPTNVELAPDEETEYQTFREKWAKLFSA